MSLCQSSIKVDIEGDSGTPPLDNHFARPLIDSIATSSPTSSAASAVASPTLDYIIPPNGYSSVANEPSAAAQERRKKKPYKELTLEEKVQLIRLAEDNAGMSQASIAERYSIAKSNVCRILQRKNEYLRAFESAGFAGSRKRKLKGIDTLLVVQQNSNNQENRQPVSQAHEQTKGENRSGSEGNETLRAHMYKQHGISRMFMCRCCNWAFPDKTSLHMHIQAREEGKAVKVSVIGQGIVPSSGDRLSTSGPMGGHLPPGLVTSMTSLDTSNFSPMHPPVNNNTLPLGHHLNMHGQGLPAPSPLSLFSSQNSNSNLPPPSDELLARLRERLMFNQLMASQNGFGLAAAAWMNNNFPVKRDAAAPVLPTTIRETGTVIEAPIPVRPPPLRQEPINVEKMTNEVTSQETQSINNNNSTLETSNASTSCSDIEEQKPTTETGRNDKRILDSPAGGGSSTDGSSPSHTRTCVSPVETFRRAASSPSAFHPLLKLEQTCAQYPDDVSLHVSPSDSHTTGSPGAETSHSQCYDCQLFRGRLGVVESRCTYLETSNAQLQTELLRSRSGAASSENAVRTLEGDLRVLRDQNDSLRRKLLECQEQTLSFLQSERGNHPNAANIFLNQLLQNIIM